MFVCGIICLFAVLLRCIEGELYRKCISLNDPDFNNLFAPLTNSSTNPPANSTIECAAQALATLYGKTNSKRATAFVYSSANKTCQLGQTKVVYDDVLNAKPTIVNGSDGVNALANVKPLATVFAPDLYASFILNEQRLSNLVGVNFTLVVSPSGLASAADSSFNVISPVQTLEGQYAWNPGTGYIWMQTPSKTTTAGYTINVWYNSGPSAQGSNESLVWWAATFSGGSCQGVRLWVGRNTPGSIYLITYLDKLCGGNDPQQVETGSVIPVDTWVYLGVTFDGTTGEIVMYTNATVQLTRTLLTNGPLGGTFFNMSLLQVGSSIPSSPVKGNVASVEIYDHPLNATEMFVAMEKSTTTRVRNTNYYN